MPYYQEGFKSCWFGEDRVLKSFNFCVFWCRKSRRGSELPTCCAGTVNVGSPDVEFCARTCRKSRQASEVPTPEPWLAAPSLKRQQSRPASAVLARRKFRRLSEVPTLPLLRWLSLPVEQSFLRECRKSRHFVGTSDVDLSRLFSQ